MQPLAKKKVTLDNGTEVEQWDYSDLQPVDFQPSQPRQTPNEVAPAPTGPTVAPPQRTDQGGSQPAQRQQVAAPAAAPPPPPPPPPAPPVVAATQPVRAGGGIEPTVRGETPEAEYARRMGKYAGMVENGHMTQADMDARLAELRGGGGAPAGGAPRGAGGMGDDMLDGRLMAMLDRMMGGSRYDDEWVRGQRAARDALLDERATTGTRMVGEQMARRGVLGGTPEEIALTDLTRGIERDRAASESDLLGRIADAQAMDQATAWNALMGISSMQQADRHFGADLGLRRDALDLQRESMENDQGYRDRVLALQREGMTLEQARWQAGMEYQKDYDNRNFGYRDREFEEDKRRSGVYENLALLDYLDRTNARSGGGEGTGGFTLSDGKQYPVNDRSRKPPVPPKGATTGEWKWKSTQWIWHPN